MRTTGSVVVLGSSDPRAIELDQKYFPIPWPQEAWIEADPHRHLYGYQVDGELYGLCLIHHVTRDETLHLLKIVLDPAFRGQGHAVDFWQKLTPEFKKLGKKVFLEVESSNLVALQFYRKIGFQQLRFMKSYYSNGSDGISMEITL